MVVKLGTTSPLTDAGGTPMVELVTINKALPGDSPDSPKKNGASSTSHFLFE